MAVAVGGGGCGTRERSTMNDKKLTRLSLPDDVIAEEGFEKGVSGLFAGLLGDLLIYGGGCNFPEGGPLEGGAKRYYRTLYALRISEDGEVGEAFVAGTLDRPTGYGASLASRDGKALYFVGGTDGAEALSTIYRITLTEEGKPQVEPLRGAMSHGWYEGSAVLHEGKVYLVGGWSAPGVPMTNLESIDLETKEHSVLVPLPDGPRIQPVAMVDDWDTICIYGGFAPAEGDRGPVMQDCSYSLNPERPDEGYRLLSDRPMRLGDGRKILFVGTAGTTDPTDGAFYAAGGVDYDIFAGALDREYRQSKAAAAGDSAALEEFARQRVEYMTREPEEYHFIPCLFGIVTLDDWYAIDTDSAYATAGAALVARGDRVYLIGGERKPGVRTPDIWRLHY